MRHQTLEHRFVRNVPRELEPGVLYISMEYATAAHSCCCGCGDRVVTPFTPTDWKMIFDGESVSLHPSIGNWNQKCQSHYVIKRSRVVEAGPWSGKQIDVERHRDQQAKAAYYDQFKSHSDGTITLPTEAVSKSRIAGRTTRAPVNFWSRIRSWFAN